MQKERNLKLLEIGEEAFIENILLEQDLKKRLYDLGFLKGSKVKCILKSPFNDPIAYFLKGTTIALRADIAEKIICK